MIIVIVLGVLILAAFGTLIYGILEGWGQRGSERVSVSPPTSQSGSSPIEARGWGRATLPVPPGGEIAGVNAVGALVAVHVRAPGGDSIIVLDPARGTVVGTFNSPPR